MLLLWIVDIQGLLHHMGCHGYEDCFQPCTVADQNVCILRHHVSCHSLLWGFIHELQQIVQSLYHESLAENDSYRNITLCHFKVVDALGNASVNVNPGSTFRILTRVRQGTLTTDIKVVEKSIFWNGFWHWKFVAGWYSGGQCFFCQKYLGQPGSQKIHNNKCIRASYVLWHVFNSPFPDYEWLWAYHELATISQLLLF